MNDAAESAERRPIRRVTHRSTFNVRQSGGRFGRRLDGLLDASGDFAKRRRLVDREVGEHLAIEVDVGEFQAVHELAVAQSIGARRRADANDPERAELALLELAAREGEIQRALDLLFRMAIELALGAAIAASQFQNVFTFLQSLVSAFYAWHQSLLNQWPVVSGQWSVAN